MALDLQAITALRDAIRSVTRTSTETERSLATCVRVDKDGTRWVRVLGSDMDTPVNGTQLSEMAEGDMVEVSFDNGSLSVYGNVSSPSVGRVEVDESERRTEERIATVKAELIEADQVQAKEIRADKARIVELEADTADIDTIRANSAKVQNLTAAQLEADHATIGSLDANYAHITNGVIDNATIDYADVDNLSAHYAEIQNGKINSALIDTAAIVDEQVFTVTGNKATISQLNADHINVRSINVKDLTVETANGYVNVGGKQTPTKELLDSIKDELQQEIDGAVETFTSSAVPLLNNYPASEWVISGATAEEQRKAYAKHVGDICYVQNSALDQNGYAYRFAYDSTEQTFKWVLIKDSDVTKALGDISDLKTFESDTTTWMEETDEGLTTIRQNHTALSGVVDKTVVETKQLWFTKANTTAPNKPTAQVTSTSTAGNAWRVVVPAYNASYPNYYYCLQYKLADGTYAWSDVVRDIAMGESQQQGRKGVADAATADGKAVAAQTTADGAATAAATADGKAVSAQTTANANIKSSVQLWFTKANTTAPSKPTAQVTVNDATKTNQWNLAIPTYNASYPNYFYCYQQQKGDGTWQWTDVVYDRSITEAQAKAQAALPSSEFNTFKTTTFKEVVDEVDEQSSTISTLSETVSTKADQSTVTTLSNTVNTVKQTADTNKTSITNLTTTVSDNKTAIETRASTIEQNLSGITTRVGKTESELETVSNPNLSPYLSHTFGDTDYWRGASVPNKSSELGDIGTYLGDGWMHVDMNNSARSGMAYINCFWVNADSNITESTKYTFLVEIRNLTFVAGTKIHVRPTTNNTSASRKGQFGTTYTIEVTESKDIYQVATTRSDFSGCATISDGYVYVDAGTNASFDIRISLYEGEYSGPYKPYVDQTLSSRVKTAETAIEQNAEDITLRATKTEVFDAVQPNLSPFLENTPYRTAVTYDGGYWRPTSDNWLMNGVEHLSDGWAHVTRSGSQRLEIAIPPLESIDNSKTYTLMFEWREITVTGSPKLYARNYPHMCQFTKNEYACQWSESSPTSGVAYVQMAVDPTTKDGSWTAAINLGMSNGSTVSFDGDIRLSIYEGEYEGPYKPYSGSQLYASQAELKVQADRIGMVVSNSDASSSLALTAGAMEYIGDHVEIKGTDGTTTVISGGKLVTGSIQANAISATSGTFDTANIPNLSATKITSDDIAAERMSANIVSAVQAVVNDLYALVAKIGGFIIDATSIRTAAVTSNADNSIALSTADFKRTILSKERSGLRFAMGDKFAVTGDGTLYADGANIESINAGNITSGTIAAARIDASKLTIGGSGLATSSDLTTAVKSVSQNWFATCSTAAGTKDKVATITPATTDFTLKAGATVNVKFTNTNSYSATASSNVTLNVNGTGAKNIYYGASSAPTGTNTTPFGRANYTNTYVYDGSYWVWVSSSADNNNNDVQRKKYEVNINAAENVTEKHIICGTSSGYRNIAANVSFDLNYPLLYAFTTINKGVTTGTRNNNYAAVQNINFSTNGTITSGGASKMLYLKGTVDGKTFKIAASPFMTTVVPTSDDGFAYIPLGYMSSATVGYFDSSADVYAFRNGSFQKLDSVAKYITALTDSGVRVHAKANPTTNYATIDADGMDVVKGGVSVAQFGKSDDYGPSTRIGQESKTHIVIDTTENDESTGDVDESDYWHVHDETSEIKLYGADGTRPNLRLYDNTRTEETKYDGGELTTSDYETVGINFGENGNESAYDAGGNEIATGTTISTSVMADYADLEILTGNMYSKRGAHTTIENTRRWASNADYNDTTTLSMNVNEGGYQPNMSMKAVSGGSSAEVNVTASGRVGEVQIQADEISLMGVGCYITHGYVSDATTPANSYRDFTIVYGHKYSAYPHVIVGMFSNSTSPTMGSIQVAVASAGYDSATIRVFNNTSTQRAPRFYWLAIG